MNQGHKQDVFNNTLSALKESIAGSARIKALILDNIQSQEKACIKLNLVYLTYLFAAKRVVLEYYAEDEEYPAVELNFEVLVALVSTQ